MMRPFIVIANLSGLVWFVAIQYYRFKDTGRACSGDFMSGKFGNTSREAKYKVANAFILKDQGFWFMTFVAMQYVLWILCKITSIVITNRLEADYDE